MMNKKEIIIFLTISVFLGTSCGIVDSNRKQENVFVKRINFNNDNVSFFSSDEQKDFLYYKCEIQLFFNNGDSTIKTIFIADYLETIKVVNGNFTYNCAMVRFDKIVPFNVSIASNVNYFKLLKSEMKSTLLEKLLDEQKKDSISDFQNFPHSLQY